MPTAIVYAEPDDNSIYAEDAVFVNACRQASADGVYGASEGYGAVGTLWNSGTSTYWVTQRFMRFNTGAALSDGADIVSVQLELSTYVPSVFDVGIQARIKDWNPTVTTADWVPSTVLAGASPPPVVASATAPAYHATDATLAFTSEATFKSNVSKTGYTYLMLNPYDQRIEADPGTGDWKQYAFRSADYATQALRPRLVIVYNEKPATDSVGALTDAFAIEKGKPATDSVGALEDLFTLSRQMFLADSLVALTDAVEVSRSPTVPTITAPTTGSFHRHGVVGFACAATDADGDPVQYLWEIDTNNPPDSGSDNYVTLTSGFVASGESATVYHEFSRTDRGVWYARARATDGLLASAFGSVVTINIMEGVRLLPAGDIVLSTLETKNKLICIVEKSDPLIAAEATNTTVSPTYEESAREWPIYIKAGDATLASAVAAAQLALLQEERVRLTGLPVPLRYGLGIQRGQKVKVAIPRAEVSAVLAVRRIEHDFRANVTTIDVGEYQAPRDAEAAILEIAKHVNQLEKENAV